MNAINNYCTVCRVWFRDGDGCPGCDRDGLSAHVWTLGCPTEGWGTLIPPVPAATRPDNDAEEEVMSS